MLVNASRLPVGMCADDEICLEDVKWKMKYQMILRILLQRNISGQLPGSDERCTGDGVLSAD